MKGDGAALVEQFQRGFHLVFADGQGVGDMFGKWIHCLVAFGFLVLLVSRRNGKLVSLLLSAA